MKGAGVLVANSPSFHRMPGGMVTAGVHTSSTLMALSGMAGWGEGTVGKKEIRAPGC
jgi:hypothetical protein